MKAKHRRWRWLLASCGLCLLLGIAVVLPLGPSQVLAGSFTWGRDRQPCNKPFCESDEDHPSWEVGGTWYWLRSPEQEKQVVEGLFNRYCIRCHGVDGRGSWDIPGIPNFTNEPWQATRTDGQLARAILEGRGSVMPPWRGVISLEEAWAIARHVRTFPRLAGVPRPDIPEPSKPVPAAQPPAKPAAPK